MPRKRHSGMFKPGQSGNPSGRPKMNKPIRDLARSHTKKTIRTLAEIATNPEASDSARVRASNALLDRGWGRPPQYVETANINMTLDDVLRGVPEQKREEIIEVDKTKTGDTDPFAPENKG